MEKPFAFLWIYYRSETHEAFQYFNTNQSHGFKLKECVQSRNNTDKRGFDISGWSPASQGGPARWTLGRPGVAGGLLALEVRSARFAVPLAGQQRQQRKPRGRFSLRKARFAEARLVVLGWLPGTHTASIFRQFPARATWLWSIPGAAEARDAMRPDGSGPHSAVMGRAHRDRSGLETVSRWI